MVGDADAWGDEGDEWGDGSWGKGADRPPLAPSAPSAPEPTADAPPPNAVAAAAANAAEGFAAEAAEADEAAAEAAANAADGFAAALLALCDVRLSSIEERYHTHALLGEGQFSKVYAADCAMGPSAPVGASSASETIALKRVDTSDMDEELVSMLHSEVTALRITLGTEHVVALLEVVSTPDAVWLCMERVRGVELFDYLAQHGALPVEMARSVLHQLLEALAALDALGVVHRDVKPENLVISGLADEGDGDGGGGGNDGGSPHLTLIDFGYAALLTNTSDGLMTGVAGSPEYAAPEVLSWLEAEADPTASAPELNDEERAVETRRMAELQEERVAVETRRVQAEQAAVLEAKLQAELAAEKAEAERLGAELQAELEAEEEAARGIERIGARERLPNLVGIESGLRLWSPFTQDPGVFSEESAVAEQQMLMDIHERLGDSEQARLLRARHQSANLKSDMQAFKAANPGCTLGDFVRWHSPRDWLVDEGEAPCPDGSNGRLSSRFYEPSNLWEVLWDATLPMAAAQQRPLHEILRQNSAADAASADADSERAKVSKSAGVMAAESLEGLSALAQDGSKSVAGVVKVAAVVGDMVLNDALAGVEAVGGEVAVSSLRVASDVVLNEISEVGELAVTNLASTTQLAVSSIDATTGAVMSGIKDNVQLIDTMIDTVVSTASRGNSFTDSFTDDPPAAEERRAVSGTAGQPLDPALVELKQQVRALCTTIQLDASAAVAMVHEAAQLCAPVLSYVALGDVCGAE
ncbi:rab3 gtpase-activating protein catalytic subunit [Chrysochromulina tobinii]|uniref:Rab3 GTPase-activating protein catalytic subunit n=1 Tax=Chrysochromulina tobinii TaxID=1460289 RepID=A0A0M0KBZ3_9EUKA|nr:rab3 gtpase-activating protein catalytic subunit [Chrysochromulina tobinii]|eukprot:KOO36092.1 rab3 gtpase-activating protein catalytic subunit [Chrysochromulina sp. CCMP291]